MFLDFSLLCFHLPISRLYVRFGSRVGVRLFSSIDRRQLAVSPSPGKLDRQILDVSVIVPRHVAFRVFPTKTVLVNLMDGKYHGLNPTGGRLLVALDGSSPRKAALRLAEELDQPVDRILDDLASLVIQLRKEGLIEVSAGDYDSVKC